MIKILDVKTLSDMERYYPLILQLNPKLSKKRFKSMLKEMIKTGYNMIAAYEGLKCVGVSGYWISTKIYSGKYLEIDNLVVDSEYRSAGVGKKLCHHLEKIARLNNCETIMLDAYAENSNAHRFYYREGFFVRGFHFLKKVRAS